MPYANRADQLAFQREWKRNKYHTDEQYREAELARRAVNREENPESNRAAVKRWRKAHPEEYRAYNRERMRKSRAAAKAAKAAAAAASAATPKD